MKTIVMYEGGQEHVFTAAKLRTPLQGGGTCDWVPEDETDLVTKYVSENGTYNASSDNAYGYSSVTVNVPGGEGSSNSTGEPTGIDVTTTKPDGGLDLDSITPPGGIGSSIVGTDPTTGNDVAVGVDSSGNLVQTPVPSGIEIITPPTKTSYVYQETIDYTGIVVAAKKKDGTTFTDARYMNGHIPMQELIFPVDKAPAGSGGTSEIDGYSFSVDLNHGRYDKRTEILFTIVRNCPVGTIYSAGGLEVEKTGSNMAVLRYNGVEIYRGACSGSGYTEVYWARNPSNNTANVGYFYSESPTSPTIGFATPVPLDSGTCIIPVKWNNPYTGDTHQDTFQISSTPSTGSSSTTTGSTGTEVAEEEVVSDGRGTH